jgi:hypothetical protein
MKNLAKLVRSKVLGTSDQEIAVGQLKELQTAVRGATSSLDTSVEVGRALGLSEVTSTATESLVATGSRALSFTEEVLEGVADVAAG